MILKKILILIISTGFVLSITACAGKPRAKEMELGLSLTERAANYAMQGQTKMADFTYNRAIAKFRDMGKFCDMSRVAIIMFTIDYFESRAALNDAKGFATLGECGIEMNIVNFLSDLPYEMNQLPEPYKAFAEYKTTGSIRYLKMLADSKNISDRVKSLTYRYIANEIVENEPETAIKYAEDAKKIDEKGAWTRNLLTDENIILKASQKLNLQTDIVEGRISVLEQALSEKY